MTRRRVKEELTGLAFVSPALLWVALFMAFPFLFSIFISVHSWSLLSSTIRYDGLANYDHLFHDPTFYLALKNTFVFAAGNVLGSAVMALVFALLVVRETRASVYFRVIYYLPVVISIIAASSLWVYLYNPSAGPIDGLLNLAGLPSVQWLSSPRLALPSIILMSVWKNAGYYMVIFLAGLKAIPRGYHEAASIDGASAAKTFWRITLPLLKPSIMLVVIMAMINAIQVFAQVYVMTAGGPVGSTMVLVYYLFQEAFVNFRMGYASAVGIVLFVILLLVSLVEFKLLSTDVDYA